MTPKRLDCEAQLVDLGGDHRKHVGVSFEHHPMAVSEGFHALVQVDVRAPTGADGVHLIRRSLQALREATGEHVAWLRHELDPNRSRTKQQHWIDRRLRGVGVDPALKSTEPLATIHVPA